MASRGGQIGNKNARRKHPRLAVSFSGITLDLIYEKLASQGETDPKPERVKGFIRDLVDKQVKKA